VRSAQPAGPKITLSFPCLYIYIFICTSALTMCAIITWGTLLPCDLALVDFDNLKWLLCVATMNSVATVSSLAQLRVQDGYREAEAT